MNINDILSSSGKRDKDVIEIVQQRHYKYDKHIHSKVKRPDDYGIRLIESAEKAVIDTLALAPCAPRREDKHRLGYSARCRMDKLKLERLQLAFSRCGYDTIQSGVAALTDYFLAHEDILANR